MNKKWIGEHGTNLTKSKQTEHKRRGCWQIPDQEQMEHEQNLTADPREGTAWCRTKNKHEDVTATAHRWRCARRNGMAGKRILETTHWIHTERWERTSAGYEHERNNRMDGECRLNQLGWRNSQKWNRCLTERGKLSGQPLLKNLAVAAAAGNGSGAVPAAGAVAFDQVGPPPTPRIPRCPWNSLAWSGAAFPLTASPVAAAGVTGVPQQSPGGFVVSPRFPGRRPGAAGEARAPVRRNSGRTWPETEG